MTKDHYAYQFLERYVEKRRNESMNYIFMAILHVKLSILSFFEIAAVSRKSNKF